MYISYGISDFKEFRNSNYYFVDKTRFISNVEEKGKFLFLIRPRYFGKSLFLSILETYYDIAFKDRFDFFFQGTDIHQNPTEAKNSYMIYKLNFSMVNPNILHVEEEFLHYIKKSTLSFIVKYKDILSADIKEAEKEIASLNSSTGVLITLLEYCNRKKHKLYVIIDEYDNFAKFQDITHGGGFLRAFFNVLKGGATDTGAPISRLFMSGVSPITLDDVTSGFNIATNISLDPDINDILGFTKAEVETMIDYYRQAGKIHHSTPELMDIMSKWYNKYRFSLDSNAEVFNTAHSLYFLREYLKNSKIPRILVDENVMIDYRKLRQLIIIDKNGAYATNGNFSQLREIIENGIVHSNIVRSFPVKYLADTENFTSLLYYFGLLTIDGIDEENKAILKIPNESIKRLYYDYIKRTYEETGILTIDSNKYQALMKDMAFNGNWEPLIEYLVEQMEVSMGIRDLITGEKAIQAYLNVYLGLSSLYLISSEKEMRMGYADLVMEPFLAQYPAIKYAYVLEIKYIKPSEAKKPKISQKQIQNLRKEAESQLAHYSEDEKFLKVIGKTTLKKLVLVFSGSRMASHSEV